MAVRVPIPAQFTNLDIRDTLNAYGGSVGNVSTDYFSGRANINKWSKHKPVILNQIFTDNSSTWWKAEDGKCGFYVPRLSRIEDVQNINWQYMLPTTTPLRISDFVGYNAVAQCPIQTRLLDTVNVNQFNSSSFEIIPDTIIGSHDYNLSVEDLNYILSGLYIGAAIKGAGTFNAWRHYRSSYKILDNPNAGISIPVSSLRQGSYQLALFLVDSPYSDAGDYYPLPSDGNNKVWCTMNVTVDMPFEIILTQVSNRLTSNYWDDIESIDGYYKIGGSAILYFKGVLRCKEAASRNIPTLDIVGRGADLYEGGDYDTAMGKSIFDENKNVLSNINIAGMTPGQERTIYVKWSYAQRYEPESGTTGNGGIELLYNYGSTSQEVASCGYSFGFEVIT